MTAVPSISAWNPLPPRALAVVANTAEASGSDVPSSSTIVSLSPQSVTASMQDALASPLIWENRSQDIVSSIMASNFSSYSVAGRFKGLGAGLLDQFKGDARSFSQTLQRSPGMQSSPYGPVSAAAPLGLHGLGESKVTLSIMTRSGVEVMLKLDNQDEGLAVSMTSSGELSDDERDALAGLSKAFQDAIDGIAQEKPQIKLEGLTQFDSKVLASVDLHAVVKLKTGPESVHTLDFHADSAQRKVSFGGASGTVSMSVDMGDIAGVGSREQQARAIGAYLKQFDQAASRGHGNAALMSIFKDAFTAMNGNIGAAAPSDASAAQAGKWALAAEDRAVLTGLADFSASITHIPKSSNPNRPEEQDTFSYQVSQSTTIAGADRNERSVAQEQTSELSARFHMPLRPGVKLRLDQTAESQNYEYHRIDDVASSDVKLAYAEGRLLNAVLRQSASQSTRITKVELGNVISDITTPTEYALLRDLVSSLGPYKSGEGDQSREERIAQRKQMLLTINEQVLLQAYPGQPPSMWIAETGDDADA